MFGWLADSIMFISINSLQVLGCLIFAKAFQSSMVYMHELCKVNLNFPLVEHRRFSNLHLK